LFILVYFSLFYSLWRNSPHPVATNLGRKNAVGLGSAPSRPTSGAFSLLPGGLGFPAALISPRQPAQRSERTTHPCFHFSISAFQYFSFLFEWMCRPVVVLPRGGSPNSKGAALLNAARAVAAATINLSPAPL
jgi:hypothetical protein